MPATSTPSSHSSDPLRSVLAPAPSASELQARVIELERALAERNARVDEATAELEAFSYSLSHDLRAPLRAIQGFTDIVLTDHGAQIPDGVEYLKRVLAAAGRMDRLIQDVLIYSRVSRQEMDPGPVDVGALVGELIAERAELREPRACVIVAADLPRVQGHAPFVTQCLAQLLDNAVKFVRPGEKPDVTIGAERRGDRVRILVRDRGIGITETARPRLFLLFQRLATEQVYPGSGLGLAIVRKAAERMCGSVGADSQPGQGSTFWFELPAA